jgi:sigma-B regulation protein RsbU (phosphoserine phosphatase)
MAQRIHFGATVSVRLDDTSLLVQEALTRLITQHRRQSACAYRRDGNAWVLVAAKGVRVPSMVPLDAAAVAEEALDGNVDDLPVFMNLELESWHVLRSTSRIVGLVGLGPSSQATDPRDVSDEERFEIRRIGTALMSDVLLHEYEHLRSRTERLDLLVDDLVSVSRDLVALRSERDVITTMTYRLMGRLMITDITLLVSVANGDVHVLSRRNSRHELVSLFEIGSTFDQPVVVDEITDEGTRQEYRRHAIAFVIPLRIHGVYKGSLVCGERLDGQHLSKEEIAFAEAVAVTTISVLENLRLTREELDKQVLESEIRIATDIQRNLVPVQLPSIRQLDLAAHSNAARGVSGDYYDVIQLADDRVLVAIADVAGKGIPAAILMANVQAALNVLAPLNLTLTDVVSRMNSLVCDNTEIEVFVTMFVAVIDQRRNLLTYVNAGHNPPILIRGETVEQLSEGGPLLGVIPHPPSYRAGTREFRTSDFLVLYTDGVSEAGSARQDEFGVARLIDVLLQHRSSSSIDMLEAILHAIRLHTHPHQPDDDYSLLVIRHL